MFYVYVLKSLSVENKFYTGMTKNLEQRLKQHNSGKTKSTKAFKPWSMIYSEVYKSAEEARLREIFLKSGFGREFLKNILAV